MDRSPGRSRRIEGGMVYLQGMERDGEVEEVS